MRQGSFLTGPNDDLHVSKRRAWKDLILEESIVKVIREGLTACGIANFRIRERISHCPRCHGFVGRPSEAGILDILAWIPGKLFGDGTLRAAVPLLIDAKRPKGGIEIEAQKQTIERVNRDGGIGLFARGWDEVADQLRRAGVKIPEGL